MAIKTLVKAFLSFFLLFGFSQNVIAQGKPVEKRISIKKRERMQKKADRKKKRQEKKARKKLIRQHRKMQSKDVRKRMRKNRRRDNKRKNH